MNPATFYLFLFCLSSVAYGQNASVYFEKNSFELNEETKSVLDSISTVILSTQNQGDIVLIGHTDSDASNDYNMELGLNRAQNVRAYLEKTGASNRFHIQSKGATSGVTDNRNETEMALNRRVEIRFYPTDNKSVFGQFEQEEQMFKISGYEESTITTEGGITLIFGPEIFENFKEYLSIQINIKEFLNKADFVLANLATHTVSDQLLESGGMIHVIATQKDDTLKLKQGESFKILFPDRQMGDDMQLFQGIEHDDDILWDQSTFTPSRSKENVGWTRTFYPKLTEKEREKYKHTLIDGDTISRSRTWYETIEGKSFEITETIDVQGTQMDTVSATNQTLMNELYQESTTLGWINCDRFYNTTSPKETLYVEFEGDFVPTVTLVFDEINSVMRYSHRENNTLVFNGVPVGMDITIIGLHQEDESTETLFAKRKTRTRKGFRERISFEPQNTEEIRSSLSSI
ncbi:MAG: OmpA family protein [Crocinitomicaceae bacterium]